MFKHENLSGNKLTPFSYVLPFCECQEELDLIMILAVTGRACGMPFLVSLAFPEGCVKTSAELIFRCGINKLRKKEDEA
jgi:hypothetical protein